MPGDTSFGYVGTAQGIIILPPEATEPEATEPTEELEDSDG